MVWWSWGGKQSKIKHPHSCILSLIVSNQSVIVLMTDSINELSSCKQMDDSSQLTVSWIQCSLWFLPQPCDPPRYGCSEWSKPLRHPFCSTKTSWRMIGESQNTGHISHSKQKKKWVKSRDALESADWNSTETTIDQSEEATAASFWFSI